MTLQWLSWFFSQQSETYTNIFRNWLGLSPQGTAIGQRRTSYTWHVFWIVCPQRETKTTGNIDNRYLIAYPTSLSCCRQAFERKCSGIRVSAYREARFPVEICIRKLCFLPKRDLRTAPSLYHKKKTDHQQPRQR